MSLLWTKITSSKLVDPSLILLFFPLGYYVGISVSSFFFSHQQNFFGPIHTFHEFFFRSPYFISLLNFL